MPGVAAPGMLRRRVRGARYLRPLRRRARQDVHHELARGTARPGEVPLHELSEVVQVMEVVRDEAERAGQTETAEALEGCHRPDDALIWPLLGELDGED